MKKIKVAQIGTSKDSHGNYIWLSLLNSQTLLMLWDMHSRKMKE